jgi:hypothetical protein
MSAPPGLMGLMVAVGFTNVGGSMKAVGGMGGAGGSVPEGGRLVPGLTAYPPVALGWNTVGHQQHSLQVKLMPAVMACVVGRTRS